MTVRYRFWQKVDQSAGPDGCWLWTGSRDADGYGRMFLERGKSPARASRISWELAFGPIEEGMFVCHQCDNPPCVNPRHLWLGSNADNLADWVAKGLSRKGERNPLAKLTSSEVRQIRADLLSGKSQRAVASALGVDPSTISLIASRRRWAHVQ